MNKANKTILVNLAVLELKEKYPSFPDHCIPVPKYSDKTANGLTKCIKDFLNLSGHQAERISSMGRMIDKTQVVTDCIGRRKTIGSMQYIKGTSTNGTADISATIKGRSVKIEVKIGKDRMSQAQYKYKDDIIRAGGVYFVATDFDMFMDWYNDFMLKN
jgi:hypothetical protein